MSSKESKRSAVLYMYACDVFVGVSQRHQIMSETMHAQQFCEERLVMSISRHLLYGSIFTLTINLAISEVSMGVSTLQCTYIIKFTY